MRTLVCIAALISDLIAGSVWSASCSAADWPDQKTLETAINAVPNAASLASTHEMLCVEPHPAGSDADQRMIQKLVDLHIGRGLETRREDFWAYLPTPGPAELSWSTGDERTTLPIREDVLAADPDTGHPDLGPGWNAYSGSGSAEGRVVYANFGRKEDFARLVELGVDCRGAIVVARYGGNFRGYKAKFAEEAGAVGLVIYTDPINSGFTRGKTYPDGGWANDSYIQRGSIKTLAYPGDPLTPFGMANRGATRIDPGLVPLPKIPVQPVGWVAAKEILSRMEGAGAPESWQGGGLFAYRLTSNNRLTVRVSVAQPRAVKPSANVVAIVRGAVHPEQKIVVGCHFDAWTFGASDPHAGTIVLLEIVRSFAAAAEAGHRPARTIMFAHWGAEEYGLIGSTEWCEDHRDDLLANAVAYINLDMAAMGPNFRSSSAPMLKSIIASAADDVAQPGDVSGASAAAAWRGDRVELPFGNLGGGSDHVGFYCHLGIPCAGLGAGGSEGTAYHSSYDTIGWYRQVVGDDYAPALMLSRIGNLLMARLANAEIIPLDPTRYAPDGRRHLAQLESFAAEAGFAMPSTTGLRRQIDRFEQAAAQTMTRLSAKGTWNDADRAKVNLALLQMERSWIHQPGLPGRPWYKNLYASSDPDSGYAASMLPGLQEAVRGGDAAETDRFLQVYTAVFEDLTARVDRIDAVVNSAR